MSWRLVVALSMFGVAMGVATVFVVPSSVEPLLWLAIFVVCAVVIAKRAPGKPFVHGLAVSLVNSVWITSLHVAFFDHYVATHPNEAEMMKGMPVAGRAAMALTGPVVGLVSGVVLGAFALAAAKLLAPRRA